MKYDVVPFLSVGPLIFGSSREQIREILGEPKISHDRRNEAFPASSVMNDIRLHYPEIGCICYVNREAGLSCIVVGRTQHQFQLEGVNIFDPLFIRFLEEKCGPFEISEDGFGGVTREVASLGIDLCYEHDLAGEMAVHFHARWYVAKAFPR